MSSEGVAPSVGLLIPACFIAITELKPAFEKYVVSDSVDECRPEVVVGAKDFFGGNGGNDPAARCKFMLELPWAPTGEPIEKFQRCIFGGQNIEDSFAIGGQVYSSLAFKVSEGFEVVQQDQWAFDRTASIKRFGPVELAFRD